MSPERLEPPTGELPLRAQLARVALASTPADEMFHRPANNNFRYLDVLHRNPDGPVIGKLELQYFPPGDRVRIRNVDLEESYRNQKLGIEIYRAIPFLPLPDEDTLQESALQFRSDESDSSDGKRVWKSLAKRGLADYIGGSVYQFRADAPPPDVITIE